MIAIFEWPSLVFTETDAYGPVELFLSAFLQPDSSSPSFSIRFGAVAKRIG